jgi:hypothetical protein
VSEDWKLTGITKGFAQVVSADDGAVIGEVERRPWTRQAIVDVARSQQIGLDAAEQVADVVTEYAWQWRDAVHAQYGDAPGQLSGWTGEYGTRLGAVYGLISATRGGK